MPQSHTTTASSQPFPIGIRVIVNHLAKSATLIRYKLWADAFSLFIYSTEFIFTQVKKMNMETISARNHNK